MAFNGKLNTPVFFAKESVAEHYRPDFDLSKLAANAVRTTDESGNVVTGPLTTQATIEEIVENFSFLDEWQDRYGYLIELGRMLVPLEANEKTDANKVKGCVSQVWLVHTRDEQGLHFRGASDAHIVSGLVAITLSLFSGKTPEEIVKTDEETTFKEIGLSEHLTPQRSNGLRSMVQRIKFVASGET